MISGFIWTQKRGGGGAGCTGGGGGGRRLSYWRKGRGGGETGFQATLPPPFLTSAPSVFHSLTLFHNASLYPLVTFTSITPLKPPLIPYLVQSSYRRRFTRGSQEQCWARPNLRLDHFFWPDWPRDTIPTAESAPKRNDYQPKGQGRARKSQSDDARGAGHGFSPRPRSAAIRERDIIGDHQPRSPVRPGNRKLFESVRTAPLQSVNRFGWLRDIDRAETGRTAMRASRS